MRLQTGRETLILASTAAFARIDAVQPDGSAMLVVLESFKGPPSGSHVHVGAGQGRCTGTVLREGEEVLLLAFDGRPTVCDKYARDHFLVEVFRTIASEPK